MSDFVRYVTNLPPEQQAIRDKCFHPSGMFVEFPLEDVEQSIPERFERIARLAASRIAIKTKDDHLTYDHLNRTANRIARVILNLQGGGQAPVALFMEHGMWPIVSHMAVLKAGKMSLQLDPAASCDRLNSLLKESRATLIVTNNKNCSATSQWEHNKVELINVDDLPPILAIKILSFRSTRIVTRIFAIPRVPPGIQRVP